MKKSLTAQGFTLIEILVVIVILGVLATLLLPVLQSVREKSSLPGCMTNLRNFGVAFQLYSNENNGIMPYSSRTTNSDGTIAATGWQTSIDPYVEVTFSDARSLPFAAARRTIWACPAEKDKTTKSGSAELANNYALNKFFDQRLYGLGAIIRRTQLAFPGSLVVLSDSFDTGLLYCDKYLKLDRDTQVTKRHSKKPVFLYADGHVGQLDRELKGFSDGGGEYYDKLWYPLGKAP